MWQLGDLFHCVLCLSNWELVAGRAKDTRLWCRFRVLVPSCMSSIGEFFRLIDLKYQLQAKMVYDDGTGRKIILVYRGWQDKSISYGPQTHRKSTIVTSLVELLNWPRTFFAAS
ncbi:hypothetical protein CEXT_161181 [Caerostris extrusa]|uniref:Uncharacterized protein n=1 Tax=Caerostris extrusa TaxID=172846 RepID=A0AAV4TYR5_CAEEX|nr:hypothetical protein CEXT_161181 [Caerostris extrusa]